MTSQTRREQLKTAYLIAFDNFATDAPEVAKALGIKPAEATKLFRQLERKGIAASTKVNEDKTLTWQATPTYDDISPEQAEAVFDETFPTEVADAPAKKGGATGAKYTPEQIKRGLAARKAGKSRKEVAEAAGVKSPNYFAGVLAKAEQAAKPKERAAKPRKQAKADTPAGKKAVKRAVRSKQPTGGDLQKLLP